MKRDFRRILPAGLLAAGCLALAGCAVGPNYHRPSAPVPTAYKEAPVLPVPPPAVPPALPTEIATWKAASPEDTRDRGAWWSLFEDPTLDALEREVAISNQNVKEYEAQYRQALALLKEARSAFFPTLGVSASAQRGGGGGGAASTASAVGSGAGGSPHTQFVLEPSITWTPDLWGSVRRQVESRKANVQVNAADLANARLSAQATLAVDYFDLRASDSLKTLLERSVGEYQRALEITRNQLAAGTVTNGDLALAQAEVQGAEAQLIAVEQQRGTYEHAIAVLTGRLPADLSIPPEPLTATVPPVPVALPSTLLERNPSIAAAERQVQVESALIGVAVAAYFPAISLSALGGYAGNPLSQLFRLGNRIWSIGAAASDTLIDGGARSGAVKAARANYDQYVAAYRQTVLTSFQQVEDNLLALRVLEKEYAVELEAVKSAQTAADVDLNEFNAGTIPYTTVVTAIQTLIGDQQNLLTLEQNRLVASVNLIAALGGGWDRSRL
jgi:NodT family efflux transporter outer membrane factor (OMF) lipoprotein